MPSTTTIAAKPPKKAIRPRLAPVKSAGTTLAQATTPTTVTPPASISAGSAMGHRRSSSLSGGGSFGRSEALKIQSQSELDRYTESDEEDYEDVFGKPTGAGQS